MAIHLTPTELAREAGLERKEGIAKCLEMGVPIFQGRIDKTPFLPSLGHSPRQTPPTGAPAYPSPTAAAPPPRGGIDAPSGRVVRGGGRDEGGSRRARAHHGLEVDRRPDRPCRGAVRRARRRA